MPTVGFPRTATDRVGGGALFRLAVWVGRGDVSMLPAATLHGFEAVEPLTHQPTTGQSASLLADRPCCIRGLRVDGPGHTPLRVTSPAVTQTICPCRCARIPAS
jgi:hypothetical protein